MEAETETQIMDSNATIYVADGKSFLENSVSESLYQRLNKLHNSSDLNLLYLDKEEAELLTLELKGVRPPVAKHKSLRRRSSADTQTVTVDGGPYPTRATCLLKYQYPKGIIFQMKLAVSLASKLSLKPRFPLIPWMDILVQRISNSSFQETLSLSFNGENKLQDLLLQGR
ncbi:uncharacterized protein LOC126617654 [Malus sylvestris]|uniref:uncharacterized protein LOC126617654 n=1 Tax=Malus sylvestris TaxID=3752 RepID=UPI0021AC9F9F|nr:uncharacterized protein LOC126617654 [Malus sylvestris]